MGSERITRLRRALQDYKYVSVETEKPAHDTASHISPEEWDAWQRRPIYSDLANGVRDPEEVDERDQGRRRVIGEQEKTWFIDPFLSETDAQFMARRRAKKARAAPQDFTGRTLKLSGEEVHALRVALDAQLRIWRVVRSQMGADAPFDVEPTDVVIEGLSSVLKKLGS